MKSPRRSGERIRRSEDRPRNKSDESSSKENEESPRKREKERDKSPRTNEKDIEKSPRRIAEESEKSHKKKLGHSKSPRKVQEKHRKSERYIKRERDESQAKRLNNENEEIISFGESSTTSEYHTETTETSEEVSVEENNRPNDGHPKPVSSMQCKFSLLRKENNLILIGKQQPEDPQDCAALCVLF